MARNDPQVNIRLPVDLKERLEAAALGNQRSFKAEIVGRLEAYDAIWEQMRELVSERDKMEGELAATKDAMEQLDLATGQIVANHELTKSLRASVKALDSALRSEQQITDRLISLLRTRLGATDEEISAATKGDDD